MFHFYVNKLVLKLKLNSNFDATTKDHPSSMQQIFLGESLKDQYQIGKGISPILRVQNYSALTPEIPNQQCPLVEIEANLVKVLNWQTWKL